MSGICDTCRREHCHAKMDGLKSCDFHEGGETRYEKLFGTPERAARTLFGIDNSCCEYEVDGKKQSCVTCPLNMNGEAYPKMRCYAYINTGDGFRGKHMDALLEWLRGDA